MKLDRLQSGYVKLFRKDEDGTEFIKKIEEMISQDHARAEDSPDFARDFAQRAKGKREILDHIESVISTKVKS